MISARIIDWEVNHGAETTLTNGKMKAILLLLAIFLCTSAIAGQRMPHDCCPDQHCALQCIDMGCVPELTPAHEEETARQAALFTLTTETFGVIVSANLGSWPMPLPGKTSAVAMDR